MDSHRLRKSPNVAIVGSTSLLGKELQELLQARGFPMGRLALLETEEYAGLLQEFAGDIQITQVISPNAFDDIDIAFFTCSPDIMQSYIASGSKFPDLTIDLTQAGRKGTVYLHGISNPKTLRAQGYFVNPHPAAIMLARVLSVLNLAVHISATILEPVSERGSAGMDELQEQTVSLLNFQEVEKKVFKGQLAFNVLPEDHFSQRTEERVLEHLAEILGQTFPKPLIRVLQVPVFHAYGISLSADSFGGGLTAEKAASDLSQAGNVEVHDVSEGPSPVAVVGTDKIHVGRIQATGEMCGLWIVADNLRIAASNAIQMAEHIILTPALDA